MTKGNRYYTLAIMLSSLVGVALLLPLLIAHYLAFGHMPDWMMDLIFSPLFISQIVSGSGYTGRFIDYLSSHSLKKIAQDLFQHTRKFFRSLINKLSMQALGLSFGLAAGIAVSVLHLALHMTVPYVSTLGHVCAEAVMAIASVSNCAGLGNRLGFVADYFGVNSEAPRLFNHKHVNYTLAVLAGALIGTAILTALIASSVLTCGVVPGILFGIAVIGTCASASGYVGRVADFVLGKRTIVGAAADLMQNKTTTSQSFSQRANKENIGTTIGVAVGVVLAIALIAAGVSTLPFFGIGVPKLVAGVLLLGLCVSGCGGLGNRLGHAIDNVLSKKPAEVKSENDIINEKTVRRSPAANFLFGTTPVNAAEYQPWKRATPHDKISKSRASVGLYRDKTKPPVSDLPTMQTTTAPRNTNGTACQSR